MLRSPVRLRAPARQVLLGLSVALFLAPPLPAEEVEAAGAYLAARQAMGESDFAAALPFLDRVLQVNPDNAMLLENAVVARLALGDLAGAQEPAARMEAMGAVGQPSRLALIGALLEDDAHGEVLEMLDAGAGMGPLLDGLVRAWTQVALGRMSEALASFDALAEVGGLEAFALYHKALALAHAGDGEGAEAILSGAVAGPIRLTRRGVLARAQILSQLDRPDEALELLLGAFGEDPDPKLSAMRAALAEGASLPFDVISSPRDGLAEVFFDIAGALQGEAADTFTLLLARMAQTLRPGHVPATLLSARLLGALGQHELASATYATVPPEAPQFHLAEIGRADALESAGDSDAARAVLEALAESHGQIATVHVTLGDLLRRQRDFDAASHAYDRAIELLGEPQPQHWVVWYTRAITHEREDRWPQAEADFRQALELSPDQPHVLNYLGYSLVERRESLDEALDMIERAVAGEPDNGYIVDSLGWVFYRLGRYEEALVQMERAVELMPTDAILNDHLGDVYWALGRKREARFQWRRALSFGPADDLDMDRIRRKLEVGLDQVLIEEGAEPHHAAASGPDGHAN